MQKKVRVFIVDDSAPMRRLFTDLLAQEPAIEIVGTAADAYVARERIKRLHPDVLTLEVEMPKLDGITFLRNLMRLRPMPVVMCSSLTERGASVTLEALALGAVDFVTKPKSDISRVMQEYGLELVAKVMAASQARVQALREAPADGGARAVEMDHARARRGAGLGQFPSEMVVAIGASTGGTEAIRAVLADLPPDAPGIVITQHLPAAFTGPFAQRLAKQCAMAVCEAQDGQPIERGHAYLARGDRHLLVERDGQHYRCRLSDDEPVNRHKPSVDVMFRSVARSAGENSVGVLLTGMGRDGAEAMKEMRAAGASTIAQDEASSVIWGMPGAAWQIGAAESLHPLSAIAARIQQLVVEQPRLRASSR